MSKEQAKEGGNIIYPVPPKVWMGDSYDLNTHALYRRTLAGKGLLLGPSQPYKSVTKEIKSAPYKYADVTGTPFDMYLNIIPGMHPFQWDLFSAAVTMAAPALGFVDGLVDKEYVNHDVDKLYDRIVSQSPERVIKLEKEENEPKSTITENDLKRIYGDLSVPYRSKPSNTILNMNGKDCNYNFDKFNFDRIGGEKGMSGGNSKKSSYAEKFLSENGIYSEKSERTLTNVKLIERKNSQTDC